jgi:hypothetical protein
MMNQFGVYYTYIRKCHNETPCITIVNKNVFFLKKMKDKKVKQVLPRGWYQWDGEGIRKR